MSTGLRISISSVVAHQSPLVPLFVMTAVILVGSHVKGGHIFLGSSFFVSWIGDSLAHFSLGSWESSYFWLPVQVCFAFLAVLRNSMKRWLALLAVAAMTTLSFAITYPGPEVFISVSGSIGIIAVTRGSLRIPVYLYFGGGTLAYLLMVLQIGSPNFLKAWYLYQSFRIAAFVALSAIVIQVYRKGVAHGSVY